jgi:hypothetical protein
MTRLVTLTPAANADVAGGYDVRLGPLAFVCPAAPPGTQLGETLEAVGHVLTPAEPRPRPFKLSLSVRAANGDVDPRSTGYRLRRQLTQLLENPRWRLQGLYFHWEADPDLDGWLLIGGGDLTDDDQGASFGEWTLELSDCYVVGKPNRQRLGRRLELADRRTGLVPLDTRATLYSTDHAGQSLPARPLATPGDVTGVLLTRNRTPADVEPGPLRGIRRLWRELDGLDGDVASFLPDDGVLVDPVRQYLDLEDVGAVRAWDTAGSTVPLTPSSWTYDRDVNPVLMGWERLYGASPDRAPAIALENGVTRVVWLGRATGQGLALEFWDDTVGHYARLGRLAAAIDVREISIVELTQERGVIELRGGARALRIVLQRGWYGPRVEGYDDDLAGARLEYVPDAGAPAAAAGAPAWVETLTAGGESVLWAKGTDADARSAFADGAGSFLSGAGVAYPAPAAHPGAIVAQLGTPAGPTADELASLAIADARAVPVLITR